MLTSPINLENMPPLFKETAMKLNITTLGVIMSALCSTVAFADQDIQTKTTSQKLFSVGGEINILGGFPFKTNNESTTSPNNKSFGLDTMASVHAAFKLPKHREWEYGGRIGIRATTVSDGPTGADRLERTYVYAEHGRFGRIEVGNRKSAGNSMRLSADALAVATGGIDGMWGQYLNAFSKSGMDSGNFMGDPWLVIKEGTAGINGHYGRYMKIIYYTPTYNGFKLGISYGADNASVSNRPITPSHTSGRVDKYKAKNPISVGLSWEKTLDKDRKFQISVVGEHATYVRNADEMAYTFHPYQATTVGALYEHGKTSFIVSYGTHFKSGFAKHAKVSGSHVYTAGAAYKLNDKTTTSLTYLHSSKNKNTADIVSLGAESEIASGFVPYAELTHVRTKQRNTIENYISKLALGTDKGTTMMFGIRLTF
jgi:hypothetical protein